MSAGPQTDGTPMARRMAYAEHLREELQRHAAYELHLPPMEPVEKVLTRLYETLGVEREAQQKVQKVPFPSLALLAAQANILSTKVKEANGFRELLVFKKTDTTPQPGHVTDIKARPDLVAAFQQHWYDGATPNTKKARPNSETDFETYVPWPCIRLAGEIASKGESQAAQEKHAATYVDLLMTARADLKGGFGLLAGKDFIVLMFGEAGERVHLYPFTWATPELNEAMLVMVHHLYCPGKWEDPNIRMHYDKADHSCWYEIDFPSKGLAEGKAGGHTNCEGSVEGEPVTQTNSNGRAALDSQTEADEKAGLGNERVTLSKFICRYATSAFGTRTHVFVRPNPVSESPNVVKLQLCQKGTRFDEVEILGLIHQVGVVPGVVRLACHEILGDFTPGRNQVRLGLEQAGLPFMAIPNIRVLLKVGYDVLEATRFLHEKRSVIHRDISSGNVMYMPNGDTLPYRPDQHANPGFDDPESNSPAPSAHQPRAAASPELVQHEDSFNQEINSTSRGQATTVRTYCYIKCLLSESKDPRESNMLLIDFNRSEDLQTSKLRDDSHKYVRTGTPLFMPISMEMGGPRPLHHNVTTVTTPAIPEPRPLYKEKHPERCKRFSDWEKPRIFELGTKPTHQVFRHRLHHEAESVFWLFFYWVMFAQAEEGEEESKKSKKKRPGEKEDGLPQETWNAMSTLTGRRAMFSLPGTQHEASNPPYSVFMHKLFQQLASCFDTDAYWFPADLDPEFHHEFMQRSILDFLHDHGEDPIMDLNKSNAVRDRIVIPSPSKPPRSLTTVDYLRTKSFPEPPSPTKATTKATTPSSLNSPKPQAPVRSGSGAGPTFEVAKRTAPSFSPPPPPKRSRSEYSTGNHCTCTVPPVYTPLSTAVECTAAECMSAKASTSAVPFALPRQSTSSTAHGIDHDDPFKY